MRGILQQTSRAKIISYLVVMGIAIYGVSRKDFRETKTPYFEVILTETVGPVQKGINGIRVGISEFINNYLAIVNTNKENAVLRKKVNDLENTIFNLQELRLENTRLKDLLKFGDEIPRDKVLAQVVGWDSSTEFNIIRINKGKKDGITSRSAVVTSEGVVGYVYRVAENFSDIITILDQNNRVDTIVERTRAHGIVQGFSNFSCTMKYVNRNEVVQVGDIVITAGLGDIYPKGIKVGTVLRAEKETYGITQMIEVVPSVNFNKLEEVIVLIKREDAPFIAPGSTVPTPTIAPHPIKPPEKAKT